MQLPDEIIREYQATIGRKGGQASTDAKRKANKKSLKKAHRVLAAKRRAARKNRQFTGCIVE